MVAAEQFENPVSIMLSDKSLKIGQPSVSRFHICFSNVKTVAFTEFFQFLFSLKKKTGTEHEGNVFFLKKLLPFTPPKRKKKTKNKKTKNDSHNLMLA